MLEIYKDKNEPMAEEQDGYYSARQQLWRDIRPAVGLLINELRAQGLTFMRIEPEIEHFVADIEYRQLPKAS